jgi:TonB family protein
LPKPSPIKAQGSDREQAEQPERAEEPERTSSNNSPVSTDASGVLQRVMPEILPEAQASIHGEFDVKVRLSVEANGVVSDALFESQGPSRYFSKQALEASRHWRFKPAQMSGEPVRSVWLLEYHFTQSGAEVTATQISP